ncbi:uncharacterized protein LOC120340762 [Styela clava]
MGRPRIVKYVAKNFDITQGKLGDSGQSNYAATYIKHRNFSATKSMRPEIPQPRVQFPPMEVQTTNMKTYSPKDLSAKRDLIRPEERGLESDEPFVTDTLYQNEYKRKSPLPVVRATQSQQKIEKPKLGRFDDKTMNRLFFKDHKLYRIPQRFGELPTFTHSLLFPDKDNSKDNLLSRTQADYSYKSACKPSLIKAAEPNIKVGEGEQCHETTQRESFKFVPTSQKIYGRNNKTPEKLVALPKMEATTKYKYDFAKKDKYPSPPKPAMPAPDTLEIRMDNRHRIFTEQREQFHGWDVNKHKRPDPAKISDNTEHSTDPMASETTMTRDYDVKHVESRSQPVPRPETNSKIPKGRFRDMTMNRAFFQDWGTHRRMRHGDFHEACNELRRFGKFQRINATPLCGTTHATFVKKVGRPRTSMKPDYSTIDTTQENDFNTVTQMAYKYPPASAYVPEDFVVKC